MGDAICLDDLLRMRWPKYWSFSFSIIPSKEISGLISFSMDWLDLFPVQGTLKSLLQHHSSKASILRCSTFFMVQLSHPYMTTGKAMALTRWTFVGKVMSLLFNMHGREELPHIRGQGQQPRGATQRPRSGAGAGRSYPMSKVRSGGCALLEQP